MKELILCLAAGFILGAVVVYILNRARDPIGVLKIYEQEGEDPMIFLELEREFPDFRKKKSVKLRVENHLYYEN